LRWPSARALFHTEGLPRLKSVEIRDLDLDKDDSETAYFDLDLEECEIYKRELGIPESNEDERDERDEHDDEEEQVPDPGPWVDMIADSPLLRHLSTLRLFFEDGHRELPRLAERAADFQHLAELTFWCYPAGNTTVAHPTRDAVVAALARPRPTQTEAEREREEETLEEPEDETES
jgi:hypothetical protein